MASTLTSLSFAQQKQSFGKTADGTEVFTLKNKKGMEARITNFGGIVVSLTAPDKNGKFDDVVLGFDNLEDYEKPGPYFGALIGRYANRIAGGKFKLGGKQYQVTVNDPPNMLHGGKVGFDKRVWRIVRTGAQAVHLQYVSKNGEEGFPGTLTVDVTYTLDDNNELKIDYLATTDKPTVVNLSNHSYFNLKGQGEGDILDHEIQFHASNYTPVDEHLIPNGKIAPVAGTPLDFTKSTSIGKRVDDANPQMKIGLGYDHNYVIDGGGKSLTRAVRVHEPKSGRILEVLTTEPGIQFYSGNHMEGEIHGKAGKIYKFRNGFCLEAQHYPDSPNHPNFPTTELKPGEKYQQTTIYRFSTDKAK
jgi:aldose 1-epimerase